MSHLRTSALPVIVAAALLAALVGPAAAQSSSTASSSTASVAMPWDMIPDYLEPEPQVGVLADLPWLTSEDVYYNETKSVFWNSMFRGGTGSVALSALEYNTYDFNTKTYADGSRNGTLTEQNHLLSLIGVLFPNVRLFASGGITTMDFEPEDSATVGNKVKYDGTMWEFGAELGFPIGDMITLIGRGMYSFFDVHTGGVASGLDGYGQTWRGQMFVAVEVFGSRGKPTLDVVVGGGYHYYMQRWNYGGELFEVTPDNQDDEDLQDGYSRFDIVGAVYFFPVEWMSASVEVYAVGPLGIHFTLSILA